jgi:hypothetical protein
VQALAGEKRAKMLGESDIERTQCTPMQVKWRKLSPEKDPYKGLLKAEKDLYKGLFKRQVEAFKGHRKHDLKATENTRFEGPAEAFKASETTSTLRLARK